MASIELLKEFEDSIKKETELKLKMDLSRVAYLKIEKKYAELKSQSEADYQAWYTAEGVRSRLFDKIHTVQNL